MHLSGRKWGEKPYSLLKYFPDDFLTIIDESHVTVPQIRGMYNGDRARKETLVEHGFRLPSAKENRPLRFDEFESSPLCDFNINKNCGKHSYINFHVLERRIKDRKI